MSYSTSLSLRIEETTPNPDATRGDLRESALKDERRCLFAADILNLAETRESSGKLSNAMTSGHTDKLSEKTEITRLLTAWMHEAPEDEKRSDARLQITDILFSDSCDRKKLDLSGLDLSELPNIFGYQIASQKIDSLDLSNNQLTRLPKNLENLLHLKQLTAWGNQLASLPTSIGNLDQLSRLDVSNNQLITLPDEFCELRKIKYVDISNNQLTALPKRLGDLSQLKELNLADNQLTALPKSFGDLSHLKELNLANNQLTALPKRFETLSQLQELNLANNALTSLPNNLGDLTKLSILDLSNNQLTLLPKSLKDLAELSELDLAHNQLRALPEDLTLLTQLMVLDLEGNHSLIGLPNTILDLSADCSIELTDTGLSDEICTRLQLAEEDEEYQGPSFSFVIQERPVPVNKFIEDRLTEMYELIGKEQPQLPRLPPKVDKKALTIWLNRLSYIGDYNANEMQRTALVTKTLDFIEKAHTNKKFAEVFNTVIMDAAETCGDRMALSIIHIGIADRLTHPDLKEPAALAEFLIHQAWVIELLEKCARGKIATLKFFDEVEVYLGYIVKLKKELNLCIDVEDMLFFGVSALQPEDLRYAACFVQEKITSDEKYTFLIHNAEWIRALEENFEDEMDKINEQRYLNLETTPEKVQELYEEALIQLSRLIY
ncbi:MAG: E3 ubiquitin-protein ligase SlrP [Chlamydiales bacterium]|nr:E3 ubiquitin-protein ligase SlrP [Chlamydiales bacterium]